MTVVWKVFVEGQSSMNVQVRLWHLESIVLVNQALTYGTELARRSLSPT